MAPKILVKKEKQHNPLKESVVSREYFSATTESLKK
jgi:hypothetical protein